MRSSDKTEADTAFHNGADLKTFTALAAKTLM